jgi:Mg2+ and Co2+ transporter CorA
MNFENIPELNYQNGHFHNLIMFFIVIGMLFFILRREDGF